MLSELTPGGWSTRDNAETTASEDAQAREASSACPWEGASSLEDVELQEDAAPLMQLLLSLRQLPPLA